MQRMMRYFRQFYAQCGKAVLLYLLLTIVHKILAFISPPITQWLIDAAIAGNASEFWRMLIFEVLTTLAFMAALYLRNVHGDITENRVVAFAEKRTFSDMLRIPYKELRKKPLGHYLHMIDRDAEKITGLAFYDIIVFVTNIIMTIAMIVYLLYCDWVLTLIVLFVPPAFVLLSKLQLPRLERCQEDVIAQQENLNDKLDECYNGNESIRASNAENYFLKRFEGAVGQWFHAKKAYVRADNQYDILSVTGLMNFADSAIYCLGCWRVLQGEMTVGTIMTFSLYFSTLWNSVEGFMNFFKEYRVKQVSLARLDDMHSMCPEEAAPRGEALPAFEKLTCDHISFAYEDKPVFADFSLEVRKGERVLITGENGSGKSTIARLLVGLLAPDRGTISYNGQNIASVDVAALREKVLLIPAEPFIVEGTAEENLWGRPGERALERFGRERRIEKNGGNLSGGQKKQLQLCRSLAASAEVLILDEPFNFIDREAKEAFWNEILQTFSDRTLIVISHDPFPGKDCDRRVEVGQKSSRIKSTF